jgi:twitching motility protein PilT
MDLTQYFKQTIQQKASDLHLVGGEKPMIRIHGALQDLSDQPLDDSQLREAIFVMLDDVQKKQFDETHELDIALTIESERFRLNIHQQDAAVGLSARLIPSNIPSPEQIRLEPALLEAINQKDGLILVVGPTGSGKSTTIASMINQINLTRKEHIITVEDPIEFSFQDDKSLIEQRQVGSDTPTFASALKHVLRQDPDVIVVGEMRDPETIATTLTAAETGHLVFSTLHTSTAAEAVERIVDVFDGSKQRQILTQLGAVLKIVVAQHLLPAKDGTRVAAREILVNTPAVANHIRGNTIEQIPSVIQTGAKFGMQTLKQSTDALAKEGLIEKV